MRVKLTISKDHIDKEIELDINEDFFKSNKAANIKLYNNNVEVGSGTLTSIGDHRPQCYDLDTLPLHMPIDVDQIKTSSLFEEIEDNKRKCLYCSYTTKKQPHLTYHALTHYQCKFICEQDPENCSTGFSEKSKLAAHLINRHKLDPPVARATAHVAKIVKTANESRKEVSNRLYDDRMERIRYSYFKQKRKQKKMLLKEEYPNLALSYEEKAVAALKSEPDLTRETDLKIESDINRETSLKMETDLSTGTALKIEGGNLNTETVLPPPSEAQPRSEQDLFIDNLDDYSALLALIGNGNQSVMEVLQEFHTTTTTST